MELEQLLTLINAVSQSALSSLEYEEQEVRILMKKGEAIGETPQRRENIQEMDYEVCQQNGEEQRQIIKSPLVGTFYEAPAEDAEPFVQVGDHIEKGQTLAIVEAMKLMNEIESEYTGEITEVFVKNGELVEYGQPLFCIK